MALRKAAATADQAPKSAPMEKAIHACEHDNKPVVRWRSEAGNHYTYCIFCDSLVLRGLVPVGEYARPSTGAANDAKMAGAG